MKKSTFSLASVLCCPVKIAVLLIFAFCILNFNSAQAQNVSVSFSTAGTYSFVAPPCVTSVQVQVWGGGGGGGGGVSNPANDAGGGGGGGGYTYNAAVAVVPGNTYTVTVGAGGTAPSGAAGGNGGTSNFNSIVTAVGGSGGGIYNNFFSSGNGTGGAGGTGGTYSGGTGADGDHPNCGGGGGGGAGSGGNGGNGGTPTSCSGGTGGPGAQMGGVGGAGSWNAAGSPGIVPGGGGGAGGTANFITGTPEAGGVGGDGQVIITYTLPSLATITSVTGSGCPGSTVTINGNNFSGSTNATVGGTSLSNLNVTNTVITGVLTTGTTSGLVIVVTPCGNDTAASPFTVYPAQPPVDLGTQSICAGSSYNFGGNNYTVAGTFADTTASTVTGCDSITTVTLAVTNITTQAIAQTICAGSSYSFGGQNINSAGVYADTVTSFVTGCDSITTLTLSVTSATTQAVSQSICAGSSYNFGGQQLSAAGTYNDTSTSTITGCDSITTLTLTVTTVNPIQISQSICAGNSYSFGGQQLNISGVYNDTTTSTITGCDSITTLTLTVTTVTGVQISQTICAGASYNFGGQQYTAPGTYSDTTSSTITGCDSITVLTLSVTAIIPGTITQSICSGSGYNFNGTTYNASGIYIDTLTGAGANGCDSIAILNLSVTSAVTSTLRDSICQGGSFTFNGVSYTTAGTYSDTLAGAAVGGCDSIASLILSVNSISSPLNVTVSLPIFCPGDSTQICATPGFVSYLWNSGDSSMCFYTSNAGNYYVVATDINNCSATSTHVSASTYPAQSISVSVNGDTLVVYDASAASIQWFNNGQIIPNATSTVYVTQGGGSYSVQVTDSNGCTAISNSIVLAISNITKEHLSIYPNPLSGGYWNLTVGDELIGATIQIFDEQGKNIYQSIVRNEIIEIGADFSSGVYVLRVNSNLGNYTIKLIHL